MAMVISYRVGPARYIFGDLHGQAYKFICTLANNSFS